MAGKKVTPAKNKKPVSPKSGEKAQENQEVIQGEPSRAGRKKEQVDAQKIRADKNQGSSKGGLVVEPGTVVKGKGNAIITVPSSEVETQVAAIFTTSKPVATRNAPVQRGTSGALGGRKLRKERGL